MSRQQWGHGYYSGQLSSCSLSGMFVLEYEGDYVVNIYQIIREAGDKYILGVINYISLLCGFVEHIEQIAAPLPEKSRIVDTDGLVNAINLDYERRQNESNP